MKSRKIWFNIWLLFISLCIPLSNCYATQWGKVELTAAEGDFRRTAVMCLRRCDYCTENISDEIERIERVRISVDKIIVVFGSSPDTSMNICIYDLGGNYLFGYRLRFNIAGSFNVRFQNGLLLLCLQRISTIYAFNQEEVSYYYSYPYNDYFNRYPLDGEILQSNFDVSINNSRLLTITDVSKEKIVLQIDHTLFPHDSAINANQVCVISVCALIIVALVVCVTLLC